ncbi:hypothetical protein [Pedobacter sp. Leaf132]|uniref:hypothetical protein n=1 Tax=Pedobacter sp. Leaf132 TaxID=2876557 RepID=UPI001E494161|nr:hypothetical protein [Pedobacter sp. Leaf132]
MHSDFGNKETQFFYELSEYCVSEIEKKMGDKPVSEWRSSDYTKLSSRLGKQTKVYLSENTLRRVLGKLQTSKKYNPQQATRDALAQFIGHRSWNELEMFYKLSRQHATIPNEVQSPTLKVEAPKAKKKKLRRIVLVFAALLTLAAGTLIYYGYKDVPEVKLICTNPYGNVPHSAVFKLEHKTNSDSDEKYEIDFLEEASRSSISGDRKVSKFFKNPGVVYATLFHNGKPIDTTSVFMQTKGWVANSGNDTSRAFPVIGLKALDPENIYVSEHQLDSAGLDTRKPFMIGYSNVKATDISGDNFSFACRVYSERNRPGTQCVGTAIIILGERDKHVINLFRKDCAVFCDYKFSELRVLGTDGNLSALAFNPVNGGNLSIKVQDKKASIFINGKNVLNTSYKTTIGKVMGIKILFNGIGRVVSPKLVDLSTGNMF